MQYLGIDYGKKRVGLALSDVEGNMAFPYNTVPAADVLTTISDLITDRAVSEIVIGHSQHTDGSDNAVQEDIKALIMDITLQFGIPIHLQPEQFSTQEAKRYTGKTEKTDASAAAIILNNYLLTQK